MPGRPLNARPMRSFGLRDIVFGSKITAVCDHNPLQYIRDCAPKSAKLLRWSLALQEFDLEIKYKRGSDNVVADYLSRHV